MEGNARRRVIGCVRARHSPRNVDILSARMPQIIATNSGEVKRFGHVPTNARASDASPSKTMLLRLTSMGGPGKGEEIFPRFEKAPPQVPGARG